MKNSGAGTKRILVVEDEPVICEICVRVLTGEGFKVDIAANGELAETKLQESRYDLILIDIRTPVMNGEELYQWINEKYPELVSRVLFTTGDVMGGDVQYFLETAGRPFLPKPFTPDELRTIVRETLRQLKK
jgi:DNA-binding response OmpR family regulator